jgi:hypothetical protein
MISTTENIPQKGLTTLAEIEQLTKDFSVEHDALANCIGSLEKEIAALKGQYMVRLKKHVASAAQAKVILYTAIAGSPELFAKPRTQIFHGVKVGFMKGKGGIEIEDEEKTLALIRKTYGDDADAFILTTEVPDKKMLSDLTVTELKKLGCTVGDTGDKVVIRPTDSEIEKTVAALLKDATETEAA